MVIMGIDPGFAIMGFGIINYRGNRFYTMEYGVLKTPASMLLPERLLHIEKGIVALIDKYKPEAISVEDLYFNTNTKTAIKVGQGRGVALLCAARAGIPVYEYTPLQVKQGVTGYGRADKSQVQYMVKVLLGLSETPKPDDAADALAIAVCHAHSCNNLYKTRKIY